jgi:hypothetical protein
MSIIQKKNNNSIQKQNKKLIYDDTNHLNELIKEIVSLHKEDGYDNFEEISMYIKKKMTKLTLEYEPYPYTPTKLVILTPKEEKIFQESTQIKEKNPKIISNYMDDILSHSMILEWAGINFSQVEWYKIRIAMKKLLIENKCEYIRFFGKIYGINSDYYIIQGIVKDYPMKNPPKHVESRGNEGINRYTFWVSDSLLEYWNELPDITHEQLVTSRLFKYLFSGDLNAKVKSFVPFPGKEMHLLKCQIVRILHSSSIVPKGYQKLSENYKDQLEGKIVEYDEEYKPLSFEEMKDPEFANWTHELAYIYPNGKIIDPTNENQVERMKGIGEDEGYKIKEGEGEEQNEVDVKYWKVKVVGDPMTYTIPEKEPITHAVIHITNERWPGTHCVWKEGVFCNIYVGFGYKDVGEGFYPTQLTKVDNDPQDVEEHKEPNPEKEPVVAEHDSDEEKKREEEENKEEE